jgi:hypothetical protein
MAVPPPHFEDEPGDVAPGGLLGELERRQDDVLAQLDDLDAKLSQVLEGLESGGDGELIDLGTNRATGASAIDGRSFSEPSSTLDDDWDDLPESADDWA